MSFLVTLTFDLERADPAVYPKIAADLQQIDLAKVLLVRKRKHVQLRRRIVDPRKAVLLPSNTFGAKIVRKDLSKAKEITDYVKAEVIAIFRRRGVRGRYFVTAGKEWSWSAGTAK